MKKNKYKPKYSILKNLLYIYKYSLKYSRIYVLSIFISIILSVLIPLFTIYLPKIVVDELVNKKSLLHMLTTIGGFSLLFAIMLYIQKYFVKTRYWYTNSIRQQLLYDLFKKTIYCDYSNIESTDGQKKYQKSRDALDGGDGSGISRFIPSICSLTTGFIGFFVYSGILSSLNFLIILFLIVASIINHFVLKYARNYEYRKIIPQTSDIKHKLTYIENEAYNPEGGKDIRIYNMQRWFINNKNQLLNVMHRLFSKSRSRYMLSKIVSVLLIMIRDGTAYIYMIYMISEGNITISEFVLYFGAIAGFSNWFTQLINQSHEINRANLRICDMRDFFELEDQVNFNLKSKIPKVEDGLNIQFKNVYFSYNNIQILKNINFSIRKGEKVALVGLNGAGKTTIVKLLCGLYTVNSGSILINGVNINEINKEYLFSLFSPIFQDVFIMPFTISENVAFSRNEKVDRNKVIKCLAKAGLLDFVNSLNNGIDSMLERTIDNEGIILSGGQKQKLILARSLYKDAPMLILDEPTAALDPIAEKNLYNEYSALSTNRTALYISHRLASTQFSDKILFLSNGQIEESGTHEILLQNDGEYASLFKVQSHYYQVNINEEVII